MPVIITHISPKITPRPADTVAAHLSIENFRWVNDADQTFGVSDRSAMFDWIVNKKGKAYIQKPGGNKIQVVGARNLAGQGYIRAISATEGKWLDDILDLPELI